MEPLPEKKQQARRYFSLVEAHEKPFRIHGSVFVVWMIFFDSNSYFSRKQQIEQEQELINQRKFYEKEINRLTEELQEIHQDPEELEKFAREQYYYKEKGEEIFVLEKK